MPKSILVSIIEAGEIYKYSMLQGPENHFDVKKVIRNVIRNVIRRNTLRITNMIKKIQVIQYEILSNTICISYWQLRIKSYDSTIKTLIRDL